MDSPFTWSKERQLLPVDNHPLVQVHQQHSHQLAPQVQEVLVLPVQAALREPILWLALAAWEEWAECQEWVCQEWECQAWACQEWECQVWACQEWLQAQVAPTVWEAWAVWTQR